MQRHNLRSQLTVAMLLIFSLVKKFGKKSVWVAWSGGKDSTALLDFIRYLYGSVPFPVVHIALTGDEERLAFVKHYARLWNIRLHIEYATIPSGSRKKMYRHINEVNLSSLKRLKSKKGMRAILLGNRFSEHNQLNKRAQFFKNGLRRYYPLYYLTDRSLWRYIYARSVPFLPAYKLGFRNLGPSVLATHPRWWQKCIGYIYHFWMKLESRFSGDILPVYETANGKAK